MHAYAEILQACRTNLGSVPRRFSWITQLQLKNSPPPWLVKSPQDPMWDQYRWQERLMREGQVVWGQLVQANSKLFQPGPQDHPAALVISLDSEADEYPVRLEALAHEIYANKGKMPDKQAMAPLADLVADEMSRESSAVSDDLVALKECRLVSVMVVRKHLPYKFLSGRLFPVLTLPDLPSTVMIVPCKFWDARLLALHKPD